MNSRGVYYELHRRCLIERLAGVELRNEGGGDCARLKILMNSMEIYYELDAGLI